MARNDEECPWCGQPLAYEDLIADLSQMLADDIEETVESLRRRQDTQEAHWFAEGASFAVMWLRSRRA